MRSLLPALALSLAACAASRAPAQPRPAPVEAREAPEAPETEGEADRAEAPPSGGDVRPRVWSVGYLTNIRSRPSKSGRLLGYVRYGTSIPIASAAKVRGEGCTGGWVRAVPRGFVCLDHTATLEPTPRQREAFAAVAPDPGPFPYQWGLSNRAPMYNRLPAKSEWARSERSYGPVARWTPLHAAVAAHEDLATKAVLEAKDPVPAFFGMTNAESQGLVRKEIPLGSMVSFSKVFDSGGRPFVLSADLTAVPADRVRWFRPSKFGGVVLDGERSLPGLWAKKQAVPLYEKTPSGFRAAREELAARTFVSLTGKKELDAGGRAHWETKAGHWVREADGSLVEAYGKLPFLVEKGQKWIQVRITKGTLVAYEGLKPVYATLISPGKGGVPIQGRNPLDDATTPMGAWRVTWKDRAAHMSPDTSPTKRTFWIADVPWIQYFNAPFAVHGAFWHERFGEPTSAGCVNTSPIDGKWLYEWSDPQVPDGWAGAAGAGAPENGPTTVVVVMR